MIGIDQGGGLGRKAWTEAFAKAGYPSKADPAKINYPMTLLILFIMVIYVTMVYGPIAAFLVELFPTAIRYTSMSLPYHIGNGWFGGMLPLLATAIVAATGDIYAGLWYPIVVAVMTLVIGAIFLRDTKNVDIRSGSGVADMSRALSAAAIPARAAARPPALIEDLKPRPPGGAFFRRMIDLPMPAIHDFYREHLRTARAERMVYAVGLVAAMTVVLAIGAILLRHPPCRHRLCDPGADRRDPLGRDRGGDRRASPRSPRPPSSSMSRSSIFGSKIRCRSSTSDLFLLVAIVTGHFATRLRIEAERANRRERENGALYAFARRLAAAKDASGIYDAIQQHLALLVGRSVMLFGPVATESEAAERCAQAHVPPAVRDAIVAALRARTDPQPRTVIDDSTRGAWLIRAVSPQSPDFGVIAINLGPRERLHADAMLADIDDALTDTAATLNRLGLGRAINEARSRTEAERLRDALLGSVSHELRTPLASILGAATTLAGSQIVRSDARLSSLATVVREEAERLNHDIQNLLDATRISSDGVRPNFEWSEVADIVNAAIERRRHAAQGAERWRSGLPRICRWSTWIRC